MGTQTNLEMVDRYLLGQMSRKEVVEFERLMKDNEAIKVLVDSQRKLIKGMGKYQEKVEFFDMLNEIKKDKPAQKIVDLSPPSEEQAAEKNQIFKIRKLRFRMAYAAGFALLVTAILFMLNTRQDPAALATAHFAFHADLLSAQLEGSGATDDANKALIPLLQQGIQLYNQGDYDQAKTQFQQFKEQSKARNYLAILSDFYLAQMALHDNRPEETILLLTPLQVERGLPIEAATKWYLALAYLRTDQQNEAQRILQDLQKDTDYETRASAILAQLK